jgi:hypothetical protein
MHCAVECKCIIIREPRFNHLLERSNEEGDAFVD